MFEQALVWLLLYLPIIGLLLVIVGLLARFAGGYHNAWWLAGVGFVLIVIGVAIWVWFIKNVDIG